MKPFTPIDSRIKPGTYVMPIGHNEWAKVKEIYGGSHGRNWVKLEGWVGSWQAVHIKRFTNKDLSN